MTESDPKPRIVSSEVLKELTKSSDTHPVFHVEDSAPGPRSPARRAHGDSSDRRREASA